MPILAKPVIRRALLAALGAADPVILLDATGHSKGGLGAPQPWLHKGLLKSRPGLPPWRWQRMTTANGEWREDDDWELFDRTGKMRARVRQEGEGYSVARPRITPEPPIESFEVACRRAVNVAMNTLTWPETETHPVHPGMTTSQFEATRRDLGTPTPSKMPNGTSLESSSRKKTLV